MQTVGMFGERFGGPTCLRLRDLARSLDVPSSHTQMAVLVPPVSTSLGLGQMAHRTCPHSERLSYTTRACSKHNTTEGKVKEG